MSHDQNKPKSKRRAIALVTAAVVALGGAWSLQSFAGSKAVQHMKVHVEDGGSWFDGKRHSAGWRRGHRDDFFEMSDAEVNAKLTRAMKHVAIEIDASQQQQDQIVALISGAFKEVRPFRDSLKATVKEMRELLLSSQIDRATMERLRAERVAESDRISKTLIVTLADVAEVLTPAQRTLLGERIMERHARD
ncbi:MAG: periplasmic heavy metal sensor [Rhizobiales bacterium]|nr:periplasmic heavy metal sensor [Hyphomicrobiales bacterium]